MKWGKLGQLRLALVTTDTQRRLVDIATGKAQKPGVAYAGALGGDWAKTKGYYRLINAADTSAAEMDSLLLPHREQTLRRMQGQAIVLCLQDGCDLNYNHLNDCEGLGFMGNNQTGAKSRGLHLHSMIAMTSEGLPLGGCPRIESLLAILLQILQ